MNILFPFTLSHSLFHLSQGYCSPPEEEENTTGEGATEFEDITDGGLGSGEGVKDVSDQIETEDQVSVFFGKLTLMKVKLKHFWLEKNVRVIDLFPFRWIEETLTCPLILLDSAMFRVQSLMFLG